jgi:hypothetical protein
MNRLLDSPCTNLVKRPSMSDPVNIGFRLLGAFLSRNLSATDDDVDDDVRYWLESPG